MNVRENTLDDALALSGRQKPPSYELKRIAINTSRHASLVHEHAHQSLSCASYIRTLDGHPGVSLYMTIGDRMIDLVEEGIDLAIRTVPPPDSSLIVRKLTL